MQYVNITAIVVSLIVGLGGLGATIWAIAKVKGIEATLELLNLANTSLRDANADLRTQLGDNERLNVGRISRLEGHVQALVDGLGDKVANAIGIRLEATLEQVIERVVAHLVPAVAPVTPRARKAAAGKTSTK